MIGPKTILVDIDHTLSDASWRDSMLEGSERWQGWDAYHLASVADEPILEVVDLVNSMRRMSPIAFTARPSKFREITMEWLVRHRVNVSEILMRDDEDFRPAVEVKMALASSKFNPIDRHVGLVIDDREDVCEAFRGVGVTTLQVSARKRT